VLLSELRGLSYPVPTHYSTQRVLGSATHDFYSQLLLATETAIGSLDHADVQLQGDLTSPGPLTIVMRSLEWLLAPAFPHIKDKVSALVDQLRHTLAKLTFLQYFSSFFDGIGDQPEGFHDIFTLWRQDLTNWLRCQSVSPVLIDGT
jgi:hypothetical protein